MTAPDIAEAIEAYGAAAQSYGIFSSKAREDALNATRLALEAAISEALGVRNVVLTDIAMSGLHLNDALQPDTLRMIMTDWQDWCLAALRGERFDPKKDEPHVD